MSIWLTTIGLIVMGFILIVLEILVIPGVNIFGVLGFITLGGGIYYAYNNLSSLEANLILLISVVSGSILVWRFIKSGAWKRFVLENQEDKTSGFQSADESLKILEGKTGTSLTMLRPAGKAEIEGQKIDVVSEGNFIDSNSEIKVLKVEGSRVVVRKT